MHRLSLCWKKLTCHVLHSWLRCCTLFFEPQPYDKTQVRASDSMYRFGSNTFEGKNCRTYNSLDLFIIYADYYFELGKLINISDSPGAIFYFYDSASQQSLQMWHTIISLNLNAISAKHPAATRGLSSSSINAIDQDQPTI